MQIPEQPRPRLALVRRVLMWTGMALLLFAGLLSSPFGSSGKQAWAAVSACPGQASIPMAPIVLQLAYDEASTYEASLCQEPTAPVHVTNNVDASAPITVSPPSLTFTSTQTQTVSVSVADGWPEEQPFLFVITHTATSADPAFDYGSLNVPVVTAYYPPTGTTNSQIQLVDPNQDNDLTFDTTLGPVDVNIPPLTDVLTGSTVAFVFSEVITPTGDVDESPIPFASYTGISFRLEGFVDGEPIDASQLTGPITVEVLLPEELADALNSNRLILAVWDGTNWTFDGISIGQTTTPTSEDDVLFTFTTTVLGEFAIFERDPAIYIPYLAAN